jgi:transposase
MKYLTGEDRQQIPLFVGCLEEAIEPDNEVRLIDAFVEALPLGDFGFKVDHLENGRPAYHPADLLKLYLYGYLNRIRSSRLLEKECKRNLEVRWLLKGLVPDHNTISNFRKNNPEAIRKVFRATVELGKRFDLVGGRLVAGDSTKMRAQNSKKNNFNAKKLQEKLDYIDQKLEEYNKELAREDGDKPENPKTAATKKAIATQQARREQYEQMKEQLNESDEVQISTSDPDSRQLITRNHITEVGYNIQTTVDAKHNLTLDYLVTNENDSKALGKMVERAVEVIGHNQFTGLYDKGYHTGTELKHAADLGVNVLVAIPAVSSHAPDPAFDMSRFSYNAQGDYYRCPIGQLMHTNGKWYGKAHGKTTVQVKHYKTPNCAICLLVDRCTSSQKGQRVIERSEYADYYEANAKRLQAQEHLYKRRQAIVEHTYGIIKRQWGFYFISTKKTIQHAAADVGMMFTAFNLRRIFNLLPKNELQAYLRGLCFIFSPKYALLHAPGFDLPNAGPSKAIVRIILIPRLQPAEMRYIR